MKIKNSTLSTIKTVGVIVVLLFILLIILEIKSYYFSYSKQSNNISREDYINLYQDKEFNNIFEYLEAADAGYENKFKNNDDGIGCYDNDKMIEDIKGTGETCKTLSNKIKNIYANDLIHPNGKNYSFSQICPETSGQDRPISCLYKKGSHINRVNQKISNLIDNVQLNQGARLNHLENSMNIHSLDPNRLHNSYQVKEYNTYEKNLGMGIERRFNVGDQLDDLVKYSNILQMSN